jgi:hypothetical protein
MKLAAALLTLALVAAGAARGDWQDELTPGPGKFPPLRPFRAHYRFGWGLVSAAEADFDYDRAKAGATRLSVKTRSVQPVRLTWRMDATSTATMNAATLRPIAVRQSETYSDETITTKVDFTDQGVKRLRESNPPHQNAAKQKEFEFPNVFDLHSALHFIRSQPLRNGEVDKLVVYPASDPYLAEVQVAGRERIKVAGKTREAIKLNLKLQKIGKDKTLAAYSRYKKASAWLSDDADRMLLKIESEIFVGRVWCELEKLEFK